MVAMNRRVQLAIAVWVVYIVSLLWLVVVWVVGKHLPLREILINGVAYGIAYALFAVIVLKSLASLFDA